MMRTASDSFAREQLTQWRKGDKRKVRIALRPRRETTMTLRWIAEQLAMGTWANVARRLYEAKPQKAWDPFMKRRFLTLVLLGLIAACSDRNGVIGGIFQLRPDSALPSFFAIPEGMGRNQITVTITEYEATTS